MSGAGTERGTERMLRRPHAVGAEPVEGLGLTTMRSRPGPEIKSRTPS